MTTLLEAAKTLIKVLELEKSQIVLSMTSGRALEQLEQAIAQEQKHTKFDVMVITTAYEQGFGKGLQDRGVPNVYVQDSPAFHAWNLGYEEGQMRLKEQKLEQPKNTPFGKEAEKLADDWLAANGPGGWIDDLRNKCEALEITNDALKADAERYKWLKANCALGIKQNGNGWSLNTRQCVAPDCMKDLDAAIDAMKGKS